jgi:hypothetical protein
MSGKSTVARVLADRHRHWPIATDDLGAACRAVRTPGATAEAAEDHREYYVARSVDRLWQEALASHRALWPAIAAVARMHATWAAPAVVEGWAILPELIDDGAADVEGVWLIPGPELLEARVRADRAFWSGASDEEAMMAKFVARSLRLNEHLRAAAHQRPLRLLAVGGSDSSDAIADRIEALVARSG